MDQTVVEQALVGAPEWAVDMAKRLMAQTNAVKQEIHDLHNAVEFAQAKAVQAETLATKVSKDLNEIQR